MALYDVPAPAKINLFLHVIGRRADGYHDLQTVFRFIDLCDSLSFDVRRDGKVVREGESLPGLPHDDDLVVRAARALQQATGTRSGAQIRCRKQIPAGGGLGGGSSDAATTLIALNRLWGTGLTRSQLMRLGASLGADVPVFVFGESAFAQGIGDRLSPVALPDRGYVVVQPRASVPTAGIFQDPNLTRNEKPVIITVFADWQKRSKPADAEFRFTPTACIQAGSVAASKAKVAENGASNSGDQGGLPFFGRNNLEEVVYANYPVVAQVQSWLQQQGVPARMSGSGACLFAEFVTMSQACAFRDQILGKIQGCNNSAAGLIKNVWACSGLHHHPLQRWVDE